MATNSTAPIAIKSEKDNVLNNLLEVSAEKLPLQKMKRMMASMVNDDDYDKKLMKLGEDPLQLRQNLKFAMNEDNIRIIKNINTYFYNEQVQIRVTRHMNQITEIEKIIWEFDADTWGDAFPGSYDTQITTVERFMILTLDEGKPRIRLLEVTQVNDVWGCNDLLESEINLIDANFNLSLYQLLSLHPSLIDRIKLIVGGYDEMLKLL